MAHTVYYDAIEHYRLSDQGIVLPIVLRRSSDNEIRLEAKLDSGAEYCIFGRDYAERLGFEVELGHKMRLATVAGTVVAYGHEVLLIAMGFEFHGMCFFWEQPHINKNVLGRNGWLNKVRIGIDDTTQPGVLYAGTP